MLEPRGKGIVLWTLRYGDEVRDEETYFEGIGDETADSDMMPLIQQLIKKQTQHWTPKMVIDPVQDRLLDIIDTKKKALKKPSKRKTNSRLITSTQQCHQHHGCAAQIRGCGESSRQGLARISHTGYAASEPAVPLVPACNSASSTAPRHPGREHGRLR